jgi:2-polyprenyl-6-methoxyphenol hydroxylase-like FAD-dependent oxidoreductase
MKILVIGAGIGGLTTAIALRRAGIETRVLERVKTLQEAGAGVTLWLNAMHALRQLGVADTVSAAGAPLLSGGIRSRSGEVLSDPPLQELEQRSGEVGIALHRARLQQVLLAALDDGILQLDAGCCGFEQDGQGVAALLSGGRTEHGDGLIGADGIWSTIRAQLLGETKPRYAGYLAWRAIALSDYRGQSFEAWGQGQRFGVVPLGDGQVYWFATANSSEGASAQRVCKDELLRRFGRWQAPIPALLEATPEEAVLQQPIYDRRPTRRWGEGRVTLLGDAAHPMTPNLGQGACQAIEDAVALADCLKHGEDIPSALRAYEARRIKRASTIVTMSWRIGKVGQAENALTCWLRNAALKRIPRRMQLKQFTALLGEEAQRK